MLRYLFVEADIRLQTHHPLPWLRFLRGAYGLFWTQLTSLCVVCELGSALQLVLLSRSLRKTLTYAAMRSMAVAFMKNCRLSPLSSLSEWVFPHDGILLLPSCPPLALHLAQTSGEPEEAAPPVGSGSGIGDVLERLTHFPSWDPCHPICAPLVYF